MSLAFQVIRDLERATMAIVEYTIRQFELKFLQAFLRFIPPLFQNQPGGITGLSESKGTVIQFKKTENCHHHLSRITVKFSRICDDRVVLVATYETENDET